MIPLHKEKSNAVNYCNQHEDTRTKIIQDTDNLKQTACCCFTKIETVELSAFRGCILLNTGYLQLSVFLL